MDDLATWLRATWDQDEREAHEQKRFDAWVQEQRGDHVDAIVIPPLSQLGSAGDPDRALAEIDAKRRILDLHIGAHDCTEIHTGTYPDDWPADAGWGKAGKPWAHAVNEHFEADQHCPTVRLLALPMADRPGYDESWRP